MIQGDSRDATATICIVGAGLAGLAAAYDLGRRGHRVRLFEAADRIGGLAGSIVVDGEPLERFYHFICRPDFDLLDLVGELGLESKLHWRATRTSVHYHGHSYSFGSAIDLLRFPLIPFGERLKLGLLAVRSRFRRRWLDLDGISAADWLRREAGRRAYEVVWRPLLAVKFGADHERISAAWIWHRIHRVARSRRRFVGGEQLGYLENGSSTVVDELLARLRRMPNVELRTGVRARRVATENGRVVGLELEEPTPPEVCDAVVSTLALPMLAALVPDLPADYRENLRAIRYLGLVCVLIKLSRPLSDSFWVNVDEPGVAFNGIIEYTNLNAHRARLGKSVVYIPYYLPIDEPRYAMPDSEIRAEYLSALARIFPDFRESWVEEFHVFRERYAQAVCSTGFAARVPGHRAPIRGLYLSDSVQFYPEDRTISAAIRQGRKIAGMIEEDRASDRRNSAGGD